MIFWTHAGWKPIINKPRVQKPSELKWFSLLAPAGRGNHLNLAVQFLFDSEFSPASSKQPGPGNLSYRNLQKGDKTARTLY